MTRAEFNEYWSERQWEVYDEAWREFLTKRTTGEPQHWTVMDAKKFTGLVRRGYAGTLLPSDYKLVDQYSELVFDNFLKLWFNTVIVGHTPQDPVNSFLRYEVLSDPEDWNEAEARALCEECCDWIAEDAFSDYGIEPLFSFMYPLFRQRTYSLKIQILAELLGVTHMRGDLSQFFVQNGRKTYAQVYVYEDSYH